jgi:uncharacterized protein YkwD
MPPPLIAGAALVLITVGMLAVPTSPAPTAVAADAEQVAEQMAWEALTLLNGERSAAGLAMLDEAPDLRGVAVTRALAMAQSRSLSHYSPPGASAEALLRTNGVAYVRLGENIARSSESAESVVRVVHQALMASEQHRANMLDPWFEQVGVGIARIDDTYYFAIVFVSDG